MKNLHGVWLRSLALLILAALNAEPARAQQPPNPPGLFAKHCAVCHGPQGKPNEAFAKKKVRDLQEPAWQDGISDEKIAEIIRDGVPNTMMAGRKDKLTPVEIDALVKFIRGLRRK